MEFAVRNAVALGLAASSMRLQAVRVERPGRALSSKYPNGKTMRMWRIGTVPISTCLRVAPDARVSVAEKAMWTGSMFLFSAFLSLPFLSLSFLSLPFLSLVFEEDVGIVAGGFSVGEGGKGAVGWHADGVMMAATAIDAMLAT